MHAFRLHFMQTNWFSRSLRKIAQGSFYIKRSQKRRIRLEDLVNLETAKCLSLCPRPCGIALASGETWTYLFGDQDPVTSVASIVECVSVYLKSDEGEMPRGARPWSTREYFGSRTTTNDKSLNSFMRSYEKVPVTILTGFWDPEKRLY